MNIDKINTAFHPAREIQDPEFFVGRKDEIKDGMIALSEKGSFIAVHGLRGVGKSSISYQLKLIAEGNKSLPKMLKIDRYLPSKGYNFITVFISCDFFTKNVADLVKRILFGDNNNSSLFSYTKTGDRKVEQIKETYKASGSIGVMGTKIGGEGQSETTYGSYLSDDLIQQFKQILGTIQKDNQKKDGILILIDEFDVLEDKSGFSSLVKTCSSDFVKFGISGIANTLTELVYDHSSIGRQLHSINVGRMPNEEMYGIIKRAEHHLGNKLTFADDASHQIIGHAEGFPYFVHLLGKESLFEAFDNGQKIIDINTIRALHEKICSGRLRTTYEEVYHRSVKSSPQREILLKFFAEVEDNEIFSESVYSNAKDLGVTNPSQLMKELTTPQDGSAGVLTKIRDQYYRFTDPVFKVYARLRNFKFST